MTRLVHRRRIRSSADEPKGPGGTIGPILAPLSAFGWLSIVATVAYVGFELSQGLIVTDDEILWRGLLGLLGSACVVLLPAALELGFPGVRRRNHDLLLGVTLLAIAMAAQPASRALYHWALDVLNQGQYGWTGSTSLSDPTAQLMFATQLMGIARMVIALAGWLAIRRGLARAGAGPRGRRVVGVALVAAVGNSLLYVAMTSYSVDLGDLGSTLFLIANLLAVMVNTAIAFVEVVVIVALVVGARDGLRPRSAWPLAGAGASGLACGMALSAAWVAWLMLNPMEPGGTPVMIVSTLSGLLGNEAFHALLLAACFAGLGRGTDERHVAMWRVFWVWGERRFRPAA